MMEITFNFKTVHSVALMKAIARQVKALEEYEEELNRKKEEYVGMYERSVDDRVKLEKRVHELEDEEREIAELRQGENDTEDDMRIIWNTRSDYAVQAANERKVDL